MLKRHHINLQQEIFFQLFVKSIAAVFYTSMV